MEKPPTFFPEQEAKNILNSPTDQRRSKLAEFKKRYSEQKEDLANVYEKMVEIIRQNPDDHYDNFDYLKTLLNNAGASPEQTKVGMQSFQEYMKKHNAIKDIKKQYPDDASLFKALFKKSPRGKVEVIEGPMTLYFKCSSILDFTQIHSGAALKNRDITEHDINSASNYYGISTNASSIPSLNGCINAENSSLIANKYINRTDKSEKIAFESRSTQIHEEQHAIKRLFEEEGYKIGAFNKINNAKTERDIEAAILKTLRYNREWIAESRAKDEILAFFKENLAPENIYKSLIRSKANGGSYDYWEAYKENDFEKLGRDWKKILSNERVKPLFDKIEKKVFNDEYKKLLENSIRNVYFLQSKGYKKDEVIGFLVNEPLTKWAKVVGRLIEEKRIASMRRKG